MSQRIEGSRVLFVAPHSPISPHGEAGGSLVYVQQFEALLRLGCQVFVWQPTGPGSQTTMASWVARRHPEYWEWLRTRAAGVQHHCFDNGTWSSRVAERTWGVLSKRLQAQKSARFHTLKTLVRDWRPSLIWAQTFEGAYVATAQEEVPVVYSHHDWLYRIKALRDKRPECGKQRRAEERVARLADVVVTGSVVEAGDLMRLGCRHVVYLPVGAEDSCVSLDAMSSDVRLVHLGSMDTTANRRGLMRFFESCWSQLRGELELWVVGNANSAPPELTARLKEVKATGFVADLSEVLRPFDLHLVPWEHATGQRTRVIQALNYGQVIVAVREGVACFPELVNGENCVLVASLAELPNAVRRLIQYPELRRRLGFAARTTFQQKFGQKALQPRYYECLQQALLAKNEERD